MRKIKLGYAPIKQPIFNQKWADDMYQRSLALLSEMDEIKLIKPEGTITTEEEAWNAARIFNKENVDVVLMQSINSDSGILASIIGQKVNVPILLWSTPEPIVHGERLKANSLCGAMIIAATLRRLDLRYKHLHGYPESEELINRLRRSINVLSCISLLKESKLGIVGYVSPGFHHLSFDEILLRKTFGVQVQHIDLSEVLAEALSEEDIKREVEEIIKLGQKSEDLTEEDFKKTARISLSLRKLVEKYELNALAIKCFPEFQDLYKFAPCATLGRCVDRGIMAACEGDMLGALTMLVEYYLTKKPVFFADIIALNEESEAGILWHCGNGVISLAENRQVVKYQRNFLFDLGMTTELACKTGPVTVARFSERENNYRIYAFEGEAIKPDAIIRGAQMNVKFDQPIKKIREIIFKD
ncbi:MAG: L-fucose/L-arabinose isomerase family protein, partial [Candidatus Baldrarchaeia archaeon]